MYYYRVNQVVEFFILSTMNKVNNPCNYTDQETSTINLDKNIGNFFFFFTTITSKSLSNLYFIM